MRYSSMFIVPVLLPVIAVADPIFSVRPLDAGASVVIVQGQRRSAVIRGLIQELERSNLIVHVQIDADMSLALAGATNFVTSRGGYRYVRVRISARLSNRARLVTLGHELQHAVEIARSDAADHDAVRRLLDRSGYTLGGRFYETDAARTVEQRIRMER